MTRVFITLLLAFICWPSFAESAVIHPSKTYVRRVVKTNERVTSIETRTSIDIEYTEAPTQEIVIYAPENIVDYVRVDIFGSSLRVYYRGSFSIKGNCEVKLMIKSPYVTDFIASSAGDIIIKGAIKRSGEVKLVTNSAGYILAGDITAPTVQLSVKSAGYVITGNINCSAANLTTQSAGDIKTGDIVAVKRADLSVKSAGDISVNNVISEKMYVESISAGDIDVDAANVSSLLVNVSSAGDVQIDDIETNEIKAQTASSGDITLSGICARAEYSTSSIGCIKASDLIAEDVRIERVFKSSKIECHVLNNLDVNSADGELNIKGNPAKVMSDGKNMK